MSLDLTEDKSTLVQVTAWCRQADLCRHMASLGHNHRQYVITLTRASINSAENDHVLPSPAST